MSHQLRWQRYDVIERLVRELWAARRDATHKRDRDYLEPVTLACPTSRLALIGWIVARLESGRPRAPLRATHQLLLFQHRSWWETLDVLARPVASAISRMLGGDMDRELIRVAFR